MEATDFLEDEDLTALLGKNLSVEDIVPSTQPKYELANLDANNLEDHIVREAEDLAEKAKWAVTDALIQVQTTPNDAELIEAAAKLLSAATAAQQSHMKVYMMKEKFKQQVYLQQMKLATDMKMNQDDNNTKILLSRDELMEKFLDKNKSNNALEAFTKDEGNSIEEEV